MTIFRSTNNPSTQVLKISSDFLGWLGREEPPPDLISLGQEVYQITFLVNLADALQAGVLNINIMAYYGDPRVDLSSVQINNTSAHTALQLKQSTYKIQQLYVEKYHSLIGSAQVDLSKYLNTATASRISQFSKSSLGFSSLLPKKTVIQLGTPGRGLGITKPVSQEQTMRALSLPIRNTNLKIDAGIQAMCFDVIEKGYDPPSVFNYPFPMDPAEVRMAKGKTMRDESDRRNNATLPLLGRSYLRKNDTDLSWHRRTTNWKGNDQSLQAMRLSSISSLGVGSSNVIIKRHVPLTWNMVQIPFKFSKSVHEAIEATVFFEFTATDQFGRIQDHIVRAARISPSLRSGIYPLDPPTMEVCFHKPGTNRVDVVQTDARASSVRIYAKNINWRDLMAGSPSGFRKITELSVSKIRNGVYFHRVANDEPVIYRAVSISNDGKMSYEFTSSVVLPGAGDISESPTPLRKSLRDVNEATLIAKHDGSQVTIEATSIRGAYIDEIFVDVFLRPTAIKIQSRTSPDGRIQRLSPQGGLPQRTVRGTSNKSARTFVHSTPKRGQTYEYRAVFKTTDGVERPAPTGITFEYWDTKAPSDIKLEVSSKSNQGMSPKSPPSTALILNPAFTQEGLQSVIQDIKADGIFSSFASDIDNNKGRVNGLVKTQVKRIDKTSGAVVDFGVIARGVFVDDAQTAASVGALPPQPGGSYTYEVKLLKASVFELLRDVTLPEKDEVTLENYTENRGRFQNNRTQRTNMLPPHNERAIANNPRVNTPDEVFRQGDTGVVRYIDQEFPTIKPSLGNIRVKSVGNDKLIIIQGAIRGDTTQIDSIHIFAEFNGVKAIIGIAHVFKNSNMFEFMDRTLSGVVGIRSYYVRIMFNDYSIGDESDSVSFTQPNNLTRLEAQANGF